MILVFGAPRSGTTWLAKILDSHPDVLLRHEPDTVDRDFSYPFMAAAAHAPQARRHLARLSDCRNLKAVGVRPILPKSYLSGWRYVARTALILAGKGAERYVSARFGRLGVPDFKGCASPRHVIKSVGLGRVGAWAAARPDACVVLLVRHPCGHVASVLRGRESGDLDRDIPVGFAETAEAARYGVTAAWLREASPALRAAWRWAILNERAMNAAPGAKVVTYEALCRDPEGVARELARHCELEWSPAMTCFIKATTGGGERFFGVHRDPAAAAERWRHRFSGAQEVMAAIGHTRPAALFDLQRDMSRAAAE